MIRQRFFLVLIMLFLLVACSGRSSTGEQSARRRIVYGLTTQPAGIDPHINSEIELGIPLRQVYDTLVYRDPMTQAFVPGLATAWTISDDGLSYTFTLRQGVLFHDGTPFNASAVAANLDRITNPANGSKKAIFLLGPYTGYEIVDDYTIRIKLSQPYSPLLDSFSQVYLSIASPKALAEYSINRYQFHQVGTGPFTFVEYVPGDRIVLRRNPAYTWGPPFYQPPGDDAVDEIVFRFFTDSTQYAQAIAGGEVQIIGNLAPSDARELTGNATVQLFPETIPGQPVQFLLNTTRYPTDNPSVRQALILAANRNQIIDGVYLRFSPVAWGPLAANTLYYSRDMVGSYTQDTAQAQSLLASAGYKDNDNNGYLDFGGVDLSLSVIIPPSGLLPQVARQLQDQWRAIGVKIEINPIPTLNAMSEEVATNEYNLVAFNTYGVDPSLLNDFFASGGIYNWSHVSNADLDNLLKEAMQQIDSEARRNLYAQAQRMIMDQALILPIRDYVNLNAASASVHGLTFDVSGWYPLLANVSLTTS